MLLADAKAQVSYDYDSGRITTFLCSVQHREETSVEEIRSILEPLMALTVAEYGLNTDFEKLINPTGRIGGGALSGKDPSKVDRSAAYMARKLQ